MSDFEIEKNGVQQGSDLQDSTETEAIKKLSAAELGIPHRELAGETHSEAPQIANEEAAEYANATGANIAGEATDAEDDDAPSYPLSYYRELKEKGELPATKAHESSAADKKATAANDAFGTEAADTEDDDAPSYPLSYYRELKQKAQEDELERELQAAYGELAEPADIEAETEANEAEMAGTAAGTTAPAKAPLFPVRGGAFGVQGIAEAAILIALTVIFGFLSYGVPILSFVAQLCFPLPMAILSMRRGLAMGICGTLVAGLLMVFIFNPLTAAILIIQTGLVGLAFGYCQRSGKKALTALVSGSLIASLGYAAALLLSTLVSGLELSTIFADIEELVSSYAVALQETGFYDTLAAQGIDPEAYMANLSSMMKLLLPAIITVSSIVLTVISYWLFGKLIKPLGYERAVLPRLRELHFSLHFVWGMIAGGFLMYFGFAKNMEILYNIGTNLLYIFGSLFLILGISVLSYILYIRRFSKTGRILIWLFVVMMMPYSLVLLVILGLFDPPLDIRQRIPAREE